MGFHFFLSYTLVTFPTCLSFTWAWASLCIGGLVSWLFAMRIPCFLKKWMLETVAAKPFGFPKLHSLSLTFFIAQTIPRFNSFPYHFSPGLTSGVGWILIYVASLVKEDPIVFLNWNLGQMGNHMYIWRRGKLQLVRSLPVHICILIWNGSYNEELSFSWFGYMYCCLFGLNFMKTSH